MRRLLPITAILICTQAPLYASGRASLFKGVAKNAGIKNAAPLSPQVLNYGLGIGVGTALVIPRLGHSSLPAPMFQVPGTAVGGLLAAIPPQPSLAEIKAAIAQAQSAQSSVLPAPTGPTPAARAEAELKKLEADAALPIDAREAAARSETLGAAAVEMQREGGANYNAVFDNFSRGIPSAADSGPMARTVYAEAPKANPVLPTRPHFDGMIAALGEYKSFQQPALERLEAVINKAVARGDLNFLAKLAMLSFHDPRAHALAVRGVRSLKESPDLSLAADGALNSIARYRSHPAKLRGRSSFPAALQAHAQFYSR